MADAKIIKLSGTAVPLPGDDVDTDRIIPAGYMKEITFDNMGKYLYGGERTAPNGSSKNHPIDDAKYAGATVLLVGDNYGCGSSREHAPQAVQRHGIKFLVGVSFAEIFAGNCKKLGMPVVTVSVDDIKTLWKQTEDKAETEYHLDLEKMQLSYDDKSVPISLPTSIRTALVEGLWDDTVLLLDNTDKIEATAKTLPYLNNFA